MNTYNIPNWIKNDKSFPFWFSLIKESFVFFDFCKVENVLDFGSGNGKFLHLLDFFIPNKNLTGVEIDFDLIKKSNLKSKGNINYRHSQELSDFKEGCFDLVYSQEVIYTIENLAAHAQQIFTLLKKGGHYIFTIGCHIDNPTWCYRKEKIIKTEKYPAYDYSLESISRMFFDAGFRISVKKLPVHYPLKYVPDAQGEFNTINDLLLSSEENKYLFLLLKPETNIESQHEKRKFGCHRG